MTTVLVLAEEMPVDKAPVPEVTMVTVLMELPDTVPMFAEPANTVMPPQIPGDVDRFWVVSQYMF